MADDAAPVGTEGQASVESASQTTDAAPQGDDGQGTTASSGKGTSGTTKTTSGSASQDDQNTFFDPKSVPAELQPAYKKMQAAFTKKMQAIAGEANKARFYDQFASDPVGNMQKLASQYGYKLTREQAQAAVDGKANGEDLTNWQPNSWQEVFSKAKEMSKAEIFKELAPLLNEVRSQKKQTIERQLSDIDPGWQQYESEMVELINEIPGLANHPEKLYRLAVPQDVLESRATQKAMQKFEQKAKAAAGAGGSTTTKKPSAADPNQRFTSVQEAAAWAQRKLEEEGKWPPK